MKTAAETLPETLEELTAAVEEGPLPEQELPEQETEEPAQPEQEEEIVTKPPIVLRSPRSRLQELKHQLQISLLRMERTAKALELLSHEERRILELLYIRPEMGNLNTLCRELQLEQSSIYRRRDQALHAFTTALYGVT